MNKIDNSGFALTGDPPRLPVVPLDGMGAGQAADWVAANGGTIEDLLTRAGAVLLRGAEIATTAEFERVCRAHTPELVSYVGGGSPRTPVGGAVYTSTEYVSKVSIPLHCEASYLREMPARIWFFCHTPPAQGGQTPIGDMRRVAARLDPGLLERFRRNDLLYVMNMSDGAGFGKSWCQTYETDDRAEAERRVTEQGLDCEWTPDGRLRVLMRQTAERPHPATGQPIWVNQAVNWHPAHLGVDRFGGLERLFGAQINFPKAVVYGDGSEIDVADILEISQALAAEEVVFDWRCGDVLLLDNNVVSHGRQPFRGERAIYVALA